MITRDDMDAPVRIWCLRHGESENVTAALAGALPNAALTEHGRQQAIGAARVLAREPIRRVYSSTALRALQTAGLLAAAPGVQIESVPDLVEVGIGRHEGSGDPAVRRRTAEVLRSWVVERELNEQVADGETGHEVLARTTKALQRIAQRHPGETVAVVGHVAGLTVALSELCALGSSVWGAPLPHAEPFLVEWDGARWSCAAWPAWPPADP
ncbi:histidine phosphatase family protein [Promicromonospora panici]|uniref:histidine phosphatase family protein n=1 Tax=Promicromonospora panici TaxID=2219658 RepID=UPI001F5C77EE|nr:histidine phosphatase family protein [Promicromonospora panici]